MIDGGGGQAKGEEMLLGVCGGGGRGGEGWFISFTSPQTVTVPQVVQPWWMNPLP